MVTAMPRGRDETVPTIDSTVRVEMLPRGSELSALDIRRGRHSTYLGYRAAANPCR